MQAYNHFGTVVDVNHTANNTALDAGEYGSCRLSLIIYWTTDTKKSIST